MRLSRIAILLILVGMLLLNGCDTSPLSQPPTTAPPTPGAVAATEVRPVETPVALTQAEAATAASANVGPPAGPMLTDTLQVERIAINASGELEPTVITATAGLTIELELLNRSEAESLLIFDLAPAGSLGFHLPAAAPLGDTATITSTAAPPTSTAISAPTTTVSTSTPEPTVPPSLVPPSATAGVPMATSATPSITATDRLSAATIWLRYDTVGAYLVRCAPEQPGTAPGCSGSVEIRVVAPGSIPPATPAPLDATPTATTALMSTTTLTSTAALAATSTLTETAESAATDTPTPLSTEVITATAAP